MSSDARGASVSSTNGKDIEFALLIAEGQVVQIYRVRLLLAVAIHLVVDGHAIPGCGGGRIVTVNFAGDAVQRDGIEMQLII